MNEHDQGDASRPDGSEDVGSVAEEATKLFAAISGWATDQGAAHSGTTAGAAASIAGAARRLSDHVAMGGEDCRYCPLCQAIHVVRRTSPEVTTHLAAAASSLMSAAAAVLATPVPAPGGSTSGVERIDLDDETGGDGDR